VSKYRNKNKIDTLIIHCADTPNGKYFNALDIDYWHKKRGFHRNKSFISSKNPLGYIGYHFVIDIDGVCESGRRLDEMGAHARGRNETSLGICMIGRDKFTLSQWIALRSKIEALKNSCEIKEIIGHNEINKYKTCPGFDVQIWKSSGMQPLENHILSK